MFVMVTRSEDPVTAVILGIGCDGRPPHKATLVAVLDLPGDPARGLLGGLALTARPSSRR